MKTQKIKREEAQKRSFQRSQRTATQQLEILKLRPGEHKREVEGLNKSIKLQQIADVNLDEAPKVSVKSKSKKR